MEVPSGPTCYPFVIDCRTHILIVCGMPGISEDTGFTNLLSDEAQWQIERLGNERREAFAAAGLRPFAESSENGVHVESTPCIPGTNPLNSSKFSCIFNPAQEYDTLGENFGGY